MKKSILYGMITLTIIFALVFLLGISNRYLMFYKVKLNKKTTANNSGNNDKPTQKVNKEINGYKCQTNECKLLTGTDIIKEKYQFVTDNDNKIYLFDIDKKNIEGTYIEVTPAEELYIVAGEDGMYGLLRIEDGIEKVYDLKYSYIQYNEEDHHFMVTSPTSSFITDSKGEKISSDYTAQIMQYSDKYIVTKGKGNDYHVFSMKNKEYLTEYINTKSTYIELVGDYVGVIDTSNTYKVYDFTSTTRVLGEYKPTSDDQIIRSRINGNKIEIYDEITDEVVKTLDI